MKSGLAMMPGGERHAMMEAFVRKLLLSSGGVLSRTPDDDRALDDLLSQLAPEDEGPFGTAHRINRVLSPANVAAILMVYLAKWDEGGALRAALLDPEGPEDLRGDESNNAALAAALWAATEALPFVDPDEDDQLRWRRLALLLCRLAAAVEKLGTIPVAYDLLHVAVNKLANEDPELPALAAEGVRLAKLGGKPHQIAIMYSRAAAAAVSAAVNNIDHRLAAYDLCEVAIERVVFVDEFLRRDIAHLLMEVLEPHQWLAHLRVRLMPHIATEAMRDEYRAALDAPDWPARIGEISVEESVALFPAISGLMRAEIEFENERLRLAVHLAQSQVTTDSVEWTFQLPSYVRALPHSRSLLREKNFPMRLALLTHEVTHVLSLLGRIGMALTTLRVASMESAASLMSSEPGIAPADIGRRFIERNGIAELVPGDAVRLYEAERQLELRRKAQILWDVWTPWLEGIAVYSELGADPALDPISINPVTACLRNLLDFIRDQGSPIPPREQMEAHALEFERRCSEAMRANGPTRIEDYLLSADLVYFHGYLAVRAIAARWRISSGRNLSSAQVFDLLLHATRFGTAPAIPDLSLDSATFERKARAGLAAFITGLGALQPEDFATYFNRTDPSDPGKYVSWLDFHPVAINDDDAEHLASLQNAEVVALIGQALRSLSAPADLTRFEPASNEEAWLLKSFQLAAVNAVEREYHEEKLTKLSQMFTRLFEVNAVLPIGRCSSPFFLHIHKAEGLARLYVNVRTCEEHVDSSRASYNGLWLPIELESAEQLGRSYAMNAIPRIRMARVIYLSDLQIQGARISYPHFLTFQTEDWFLVRGATGWSQAIEEVAPDVWEGMHDLIRRRMTDEAVGNIERRFVASGREAIDRTLAWLTASSEWWIDGETVSVGGWVRHLTTLGRALLDPAVRDRARQAATGAMMVAVYGETNYATALANSSFQKLLGRAPLTQDFAVALYETGSAAGESSFLDGMHGRLSAAQSPVFVRGAFGWDVRPAVLGQEVTEQDT